LIPDGAVSWWPIGDNDILGNDNGEIFGGVALTDGQVGSALNFNGLDGYVRIPASAALNVRSFTFECWIYPGDIQARRSIVEFTQPGVYTGVHMAMGTQGSLSPAPGAIYANLRGANLVNHVLASPLNTLRSNEWQHVAMSLDQPTGTGRLFVNGAIVASQVFGPFEPYTTLPLYFGIRPQGNVDYNGAPPFAGKMDEMTLYNRALAPEEIQQIYLAGPAGKCDGPRLDASTLPDAYRGHPYQASLSGSRGMPPNSFSIKAGALPPGLSLASSGEIGGVPSGQGRFAFLIRLQDANGNSDERSFEILVPACTPLSPALISWWTAEGNGRDIGDTNDLQLIDVSYTPREAGQAFEFNGVSSFGVAQSSPTLSVESFTLEAWIRPADLFVARPILEFSSPAGPLGVHLWLSTSTNNSVSPGALYANLRDTLGRDHAMSTASGALARNQWQHVALTYDQQGGLAVLYINGVRALTQLLGFLSPNTAAPLYFGYRFPGSPFFNGAPPFAGAMDEIALYNRVLSEPEVRAIYEARAEGKCLQTLWARAGRDTVLLGWLSAATNAVLQTSGEISAPTWEAVTEIPATSRAGRRQALSQPVTGGHRFFRLRH